jgi:two-component system OmpR family response regulator
MRVNAPGAWGSRRGDPGSDRAGRTVELNGRAIALSGRERALLDVFLSPAGRVVSKPEIIEFMCERGEALSTNAVEVYVHRLRCELSAGDVKIYTVRGLGYCLSEVDRR